MCDFPLLPVSKRILPLWARVPVFYAPVQLVMGNQQSGDSSDAIPEPSGAEAGPVLLGREHLDIEQDAKADVTSSSFDVASLNKQQLVGPYLFGVAAPFFFVAAISALLPVPQDWQFSFTSLMLGDWSFVLFLLLDLHPDKTNAM